MNREAGKGDDRRPGKPEAYQEGHDRIDWSAHRTERQADQAVVEDLRAQNLANLRNGQKDGMDTIMARVTEKLVDEAADKALRDYAEGKGALKVTHDGHNVTVTGIPNEELFSGEVGTLNDGLRYVGMDMASEPDMHHEAEYRIAP